MKGLAMLVLLGAIAELQPVSIRVLQEELHQLAF